MIAATLSTALVAFTLTLVYGQHRREVREARARRQAAVDAAVFDTVERWRREQRVNEIAAEVRGAFDQALASRPHLAAVRARSEAAVLDDDAAVAEWLGQDR